MKYVWLVIAAVFLAVAADPALAAKKKKAPPRCVDRPYTFNLGNFIWPGNPEPRGNGCAPAVYSGGRYVGQDPDPNIRFQLNRDPASGYTAGQFGN